MTKENLNKFLTKKSIWEKFKDFKNLWTDFCTSDSYLTGILKEEFLTALKDFEKDTTFFKRFIFFLRRKKMFRSKDLKSLKYEIMHYNEKYIQRKIVEHKEFLDGKEGVLQTTKFGLDPQQKEAVVVDDKYNLVIAGAGSGKTRVIVTKIAYLLRTNKDLQPDQLLILSFTRVAAKEMETRLKEIYGLSLKVNTFHSLGFDIIKEESDYHVDLLFDGSETKKYKLIEDIVMTLLNEPDFEKTLSEYILYYINEDEESSFGEKELYFKYMRNKRYSTLDGNEVKSIAERDIGNFLFSNNIRYEYEPKVDWIDETGESQSDNEYRSYHPDFYLIDYDIYIEHWGLDRNMEVAPWFNKSSEEYLRDREWKLSQFEKYDKNLVETWFYEYQEGTLISNLKNKLLSLNPTIEFRASSLNALIERVDIIRRQYGEIIKLISSFITTAKSNYLSIKEIKNNLHDRSFKNDYTRRKIMLFTQIALKVFEKYEQYLSAHNKIDFNDMINVAIEFAKNQKEKYLEKYRYILVDEFQDISYQRIELLRTFINDYNNSKLFCVGDDWQSIYQFNGSIVDFFVDFAKYFRNPTIVYLPTNYRSTRNIVDIGNKLIKKNKMQIRKTIKSNQGYGVIPILFEIQREDSLSNSSKTDVKRKVLIYYNLISFLINHNVKPKEIMVISRFTRILKELEILCGANDIPTEMHHGGIRFYTAHKSKGDEAKYVIIIDVISGMFGFPSEIQDSSVLEVARRFKPNNYIEEERRLFYVALTRSKKFLYIFTDKGKSSMFLNEIKNQFIQINIYNYEPWEECPNNNSLINNYMSINKRNLNRNRINANENKALSNFLKDYINENPDYDMICPKCRRALLVRYGKYGPFISCSGFPQCKYKHSSNLC